MQRSSASSPLLARSSGGARRLAAVSRRRVQFELLGQGLLCAEARGRRSEGAAHAAGAQGDLEARRRRARQCVHAHRARAVRPDSLARRAVHSRRDHAAAAMVSIPHRQGLVLVAHRHGAAVHSVHAQAARQEPASCAHSRAVHDCARTRAPLFSRRLERGGWLPRFSGARSARPPDRSADSAERCASAPPAARNSGCSIG
jgi:hypothetical protein